MVITCPNRWSGQSNIFLNNQISYILSHVILFKLLAIRRYFFFLILLIRKCQNVSVDEERRILKLPSVGYRLLSLSVVDGHIHIYTLAVAPPLATASCTPPVPPERGFYCVPSVSAVFFVFFICFFFFLFF
jgi:hypothetical protein